MTNNESISGDIADFKEATLVIGLPGVGKSTLCQLLAGNPDLKSESEPDSYDFFITDGNININDSTVTSKSYLPTLVPVSNKAALLDFPGFDLHEMFTSVFMQHIKSVKILAVTSHHAVRKGVDRSAFLDLLNNLVGLVRSVPNYKNSIGLVVNKVEIQIQANGQLVPDEDVIKQAAAFLNEVRTALEATERTSPRVELLNVFLSQDNEGHPKIGILRRPAKAGPLNEIEAITIQKAKIDVLLEKLSFSTCVAADFAMSVTEEARLCKVEENKAIETQKPVTTNTTKPETDLQLSVVDNHFFSMSFFAMKRMVFDLKSKCCCCACCLRS